VILQVRQAGLGGPGQDVRWEQDPGSGNRGSRSCEAFLADLLEEATKVGSGRFLEGQADFVGGSASEIGQRLAVKDGRSNMRFIPCPARRRVPTCRRLGEAAVSGLLLIEDSRW